MAGSAAHVTATVGLLKLTGKYSNNPAALFPTSSPRNPPPTAHPGAGVGRALKLRHESRSLGCCSSCFHSSLFMITKEKNKIAPVGFTSCMEVSVVSLQTTQARRKGREGKGREAKRQHDGTSNWEALEQVTWDASRAPTVDLWRGHRCYMTALSQPALCLFHPRSPGKQRAALPVLITDNLRY